MESGNIVINQRERPHFDTLCTAIRDAVSGSHDTRSQQNTIAELRRIRAQLASPFDVSARDPPNPQDRAKMANMGRITLTLGPESVTGSAYTNISLGPDLVSVAFALSDELGINEFQAAVLLNEARSRAAHRPDHDVVAAAKELHALRRRETVLYLQEILRVGLLPGGKTVRSDESFLSALMRERDLLVVEHNVFVNVANRLQAGIEAKLNHQTASRALEYGDFVLLAETIFLLSYTVQLSKAEAVVLKNLLKLVETLFDAMQRAQPSPHRNSRGFSAPSQPLTAEDARLPEPESEMVSPQRVEIESVRNLLLLSWMSALDRSRYHDAYDPRTGQQDVNQLLKDASFIPLTINYPKLEEGKEDEISKMPRAQAAAELCATVFRLATAEPDESEAVTAFLRLSAYANVLTFLSNDIALWIEKRAGSLSPDADLYADVLEDLAHDIAEAPHLLNPLIQFAQQEVYEAAASAAYSPPFDMISAYGQAHSGFQPPFPGNNAMLGGRKGRPLSTNAIAAQSPPRRMSSNASGIRGRPPKPPGGRLSNRPQSMSEALVHHPDHNPSNVSLVNNNIGKEEDKMTAVSNSCNVVAALATFTARAIALAPTKLANDSLHGGLRYFSTQGAGSVSFVHRIGEAVIDFWDVAMRDAYAPGGVGDTFREALIGFLELLASIAKKQVSPTHAASIIRFMADGGNPIVSLNQAVRIMSLINSRLGAVASEIEAEVDESDVELLEGIVHVISNAAKAVSAHGGIMALLGEEAKEIALCISALAVHNVTPSLKKTLLEALVAIGHKRAIVSFLESASRDKAAPIRHFLRSADSQTGDYDSTVAVLELAATTCTWSEEEFPESSVESVVTWFAVEEVLMYWSRRKYAYESHRWKVVRAAVDLIRDLVYKDPNHPRTFRVLARLLSPAPGTGEASYSLRTILWTCGLMRGNLDGESSTQLVSNRDRLTTNINRVCGKDSLILAACFGLGEAYREMQGAVRVSARLLSILLSLPPGRVSVPGVVVVPAGELVLGELKALRAASSLVFTIDGFEPALARAGYGSSVCSAVLALLSNAAMESPNVAAIFDDSSNGSRQSATQFRSSLADIIARSVSDPSSTGGDDVAEHAYSIASKEYPDPPIMFSALRIVEACLGTGGSGRSGIFLLGLRLDSSLRYLSAEYGVLGALIEFVVSGSTEDARIDNKGRATAANFLERLAANTVQSTSLAVLEHLKDVGQSEDAVRGGGFADEMLFRTITAFSDFEPQSMAGFVDWRAAGQLYAACLSLSALQVRLFPEYELERCCAKVTKNRSVERLSNGDVGEGSRGSHHMPPPPLELLRVLNVMASGGELDIAFEAFRSWRHLLGARLAVHERNRGHASTSLLYELCAFVLEALSMPGKEQNLSGIVKKDGGEVAAAVVLLCLQKMRACENPNYPDSEESIAVTQISALIGGIVRALTGVSGVGASSAQARTSLYSALLICGSLAEKRLSEEACLRALSAKVGQRQVSGTEVVVSSACVDAVSGPTPASKCTALAVAAMVTSIDPVRAISTLGSQNRLRRVLQASLTVDNKLASFAAGGNSTSGAPGSDSTHERATSAVIETALALIHAVGAAGLGARTIADSRCVEVIMSLLPTFGESNQGKFSDIIGTRRMEADKTVGSDRNVGDINMVDRAPLGNNNFVLNTENMDEVGDVFSSAEQRRPLFAALTAGLATAIASASNAVDSSVTSALSSGRELFSEFLRNVQMPGTYELETMSRLGVILSRLPEEVRVKGSGSYMIAARLAQMLAVVIPPYSQSLHLGASGSFVSAGIHLKEPENAREARRVRISHPEGGSLFERDLVTARVICAQNVFAALRHPSVVMGLFSPELGDGTRPEGTVSLRGSLQPIGSLSTVFRIARVMLSEFQRAAEESMQIESRLSGETGSSISAQRLNEIADFCCEELGVERTWLIGRVAIKCVRETSAAALRHGETCVSVFESALFILREYVRTAQEAMRGQMSQRVSLGGSYLEESGVDGWSSPNAMSMEEAEQLLHDARKLLLPLCKDVEGLQDSVWCRKESSFSKQLCRQIRTACTGGRVMPAALPST